jgi:hypothetical protein
MKSTLLLISMPTRTFLATLAISSGLSRVVDWKPQLGPVVALVIEDYFSQKENGG